MVSDVNCATCEVWYGWRRYGGVCDQEREEGWPCAKRLDWRCTECSLWWCSRCDDGCFMCKAGIGLGGH